MADINFYHLDGSIGQSVKVFVSTEWEGTPQETEEMRPEWFNVNNIPYKKMWEDDEIWLPQILAGKKIKADFLFGDDQTLIEHRVEEV